MFIEHLPCARPLESKMPHIYIQRLWLDWAVHNLYNCLWQLCNKHTGNEITLYTIVIDICHHKFVHRIYNIKSEPNTNKGIWRIMMCPCRFRHDWAIGTELKCRFIICAPLVWDVDIEGGYACVGAGYIWEISVSSIQYCWESKTTLKNKSLSNVMNRSHYTYVYISFKFALNFLLKFYKHFFLSKLFCHFNNQNHIWVWITFKN